MLQICPKKKAGSPLKMANFPIQKYPIVCNECPGQQFQSKEEAVKHVSDTHEIFTPNLVKDYINVDKLTLENK